MDKKLNYNTPKLEIIDIEIDDMLLVSGVLKNEGTFNWDEGESDEEWQVMNMKKLSKILLSVIALVVSAFTIGGNINSSYLSGVEESSTNDVSKRLAVKLSQIDTEEEVSVSKTYVQRGFDGEGNQYIRYVTAVKGDIKGLQYVRNCFDLEESKQTATKTVTTIYKGVMADGEVKYYNGTDFDTNPNTDYYLACYQIKITEQRQQLP